MCPQLSGIYDAAFMQPVCRIKENLSILTQGRWAHYRADFIEPLPPSSPLIVETITASGATVLAALGTIARRVVAILQVNDLEFLQLRGEPLDYVEGIITEISQGRFQTRNVQARLSPMTRQWDPDLVTTSFWVMGFQRDMQLEVRNLLNYATPHARFLFFGYRFLLKPWEEIKTFNQTQKDKLAEGDLATVKELIGQTTWLPAEGRA